MKIKNNGLKRPDSPYIPIMEPNTFFANKKVQTTYKEYEAVEDENNTVRLGAFKDYELFIPETIQTLSSEFRGMAVTLYNIDSFNDKPEIENFFDIFDYSHNNKYFTTTYNDKGFITSYEIDNILITFKYNENDQIIEWTATISGEIPCTRKFLYNENKLLSKVIDPLPSSKTQEWLYDEKGDMIAILKNNEITQKYEYNYNQKKELIGVKGLSTEESFLYDEKGNKVQYNMSYDGKVYEDYRKVFINSYEKDILTKQEILDYYYGDKEVLFFNEQGRFIQRCFFEHKPYRDFELITTTNYHYFEDKVKRTYINKYIGKEVIVCKDIEYAKEPIYRDCFLKHYGEIWANENFSFFVMYNLNDIEEIKFMRTYLNNGEWETVFYKYCKPEYIIRKECTIVEN